MKATPYLSCQTKSFCSDFTRGETETPGPGPKSSDSPVPPSLHLSAPATRRNQLSQGHCPDTQGSHMSRSLSSAVPRTLFLDSPQGGVAQLTFLWGFCAAFRRKRSSLLACCRLAGILHAVNHIFRQLWGGLRNGKRGAGASYTTETSREEELPVFTPSSPD